MERWPVRRCSDVDERVAPLPAGGTAPLLELDDDVARLPGRRVAPGEDGIDALAGERQPVLEDDLHVLQTGVREVTSENRQTAPPRPLLARRREPDAQTE